MPRRMYKNAAEKQKAYRERLKAKGLVASQRKIKPKRQSRPARLLALEEAVRELAEEYQQWLDSIPENLAGGSLAEELEQVVSQLEAVADDLGEIEPPRGFGR